MAQTVGVVYEETDYSKFSRLAGNRGVDEKRKNKIRQSIKKVGYVRSPIVVNEKLEIIDGQGRFEVLRELGKPIHYVIAYGAGVKECQWMNIGQTNWKTFDYIKSYAELGNESYVMLLKLIKDNEWMMIEEIYGAVTNKIQAHGHCGKILQKGTFKMTKEEYAMAAKTIREFHEFMPIIRRIPGSTAVKVTAMMWILRNTTANHKRLYTVLNKGFPKMSPCVDSRPDIFLREISDLYNRGLSAKNCIYFETEYKQFSRESKRNAM